MAVWWCVAWLLSFLRPPPTVINTVSKFQEVPIEIIENEKPPHHHEKHANMDTPLITSAAPLITKDV